MRGLICAGLLIASAPVFAAPLPIANHSFEAPYLGGNVPPALMGVVPNSAFPVGDPPAGWTEIAPINAPSFVGVLNPTDPDDPICLTDMFFPAGAPDGENVLLLYHDEPVPPANSEYGVSQVLAGETLQPNTVYTLRVEVGNIGSGTSCAPPWSGFGAYGIDGFPGYRVQLLAGGVLLQENTNVVSPPEGVFETVTLEYVTAASPPPGDIEIRLITRNGPAALTETGVEVDFDDVRLDATAIPPTAVPTLPLGLALLAGIGALACGIRFRQ